MRPICWTRQSGLYLGKEFPCPAKVGGGFRAVNAGCGRRRFFGFDTLPAEGSRSERCTGAECRCSTKLSRISPSRTSQIVCLSPISRTQTSRVATSMRYATLIFLLPVVRHVQYGMLYLYTKQAQGDLTAAQVRQIARLVREEFK